MIEDKILFEILTENDCEAIKKSLKKNIYVKHTLNDFVGF